jgi:2-oxoglutarate ferredoxin oxidoreductase subunit alpha
MNEKRFRKLAPLRERADLFEIQGAANAPLALVSWGSSAGVAREAFLQAQVRDIPVKLLVPTLLYPVAEEVYRAFFSSVRAGLVLELSHQGQLYRVLRMFIDLPPGVTSFARSGAQPFRADEVLERLARQAETLR